MEDLSLTPVLEAAPAVITESAPVNGLPAVITESAPVEVVTPEEPSKAVKELIHTRKRAQDAERRVAYLEGLAEGRGPVQAPVQAQPESITAPVVDNFETYEEYELAKETYLETKIEQRLATKFQQAQQVQSQQEGLKTFEQRIDKAAESDPTIYDIRHDPTLPVSTSMAQILQSSEVAPDLLKWIDGNRVEATKIANMNPLQAAREMSKIEARILYTPKPAPLKVVSSAPEPISTVTPAGSINLDEEKMPMDQWIARRNKETGKVGGGLIVGRSKK
jgi:hypothetical protein